MAYGVKTKYEQYTYIVYLNGEYEQLGYSTEILKSCSSLHVYPSGVYKCISISVITVIF